VFLTKENVRVNMVMIVAVLLALVLMFVVPTAEAQELSHARPALGFANTYNDTMVVQLTVGERANRLPDAYLFYSEDGSAFYVQRYIDGALEAVPVLVPASSSLMLPAPSPVLVDNKWEHHIWLNATTVTDSVFVIPFDR
jgi:hypothetical protein